MSLALPLAAWQRWSPLRLLHRRFRAWWTARLPLTDSLQLNQRNIYILPTRAGLMFAATLLLLLLASINYQLSLGYLLTFLLAGSGLASMHLTHGTLRGLQLQLRPPGPVHAGEAALLEIGLGLAGERSPARFGIGLKLESAGAGTLVWTDVPAGGQVRAQVSLVPPQRGHHAVPPLSVETRFPLGLFRAWAVWRPAAQLLVYPALEHPAPPLPKALGGGGGQHRGRSSEGSETEGIRAYRRGDSLKTVVWKKAAKSLASGGELVSRDTSAMVPQSLWLDWQAAAPLEPEARLSRLASWVSAADQAQLPFGLRLPGQDIAVAQGETQRHACLRALALWL